MKKYINHLVLKITFLLGIVISISACKKDDQPTEAARSFKPSDVKVSASAISAKLTWTAPLMSTGKALKYSIDFSTDSLFSSIKYSTTSDTTGISVTEDNLAVRTKYFARVKANATETQPESKYLVSSSFQLTGIQLFLPVRDSEIKETGITLRYAPTVGLTSIVLTPSTGNTITATLSTGDATAGLKAITGLTAGIKYSAELFAGTKSKGITTFTTQMPTSYTTVISATDDLAATIAAAANGAVIGLNPGTYNLTAATTFITQKTITLKSTSGTATDTKINYKEFDLEGTGAGLTLSGLELDGTIGASPYFINLIGSQTNVGAAATFTNIIVDNCIAHGSTTAFLRGDRGAAVKDFKITGITVNNSIVYDMGANGTSTYYTFNITKLQFNTLTVSKSTFYNCGPGLVISSTPFIADQTPTVLISYSTFNAFGGSSKYALLDAATNPINFSIQNSILANTPKSGTVNAAAIRGTGAGSSITISNTNYFNLNSALTAGTALTFSAATLSVTQQQNLGWTATTTDFTLPVGSTLRTSSTTGTAIGDPRWAF
ncbi:DUF4957 domain-containing protein [Pedobacter riviphilus]|uniref:DUF4957 domain-containing protein n=1 Tax=Pedobacter riviphilus TaxID=2766984 RepID=A0ABX6TET3_9SPHI|nr:MULTISPECIES: fibronectin type III domain-containing protein [Pedobacter]NII84158.1 hypothetical protein [Pedobacter sp. SG908]NMN38926.1 hypothetical protein [Pedobacter sp. SG918]QNR84018.1 DUF4957 domain-containing protein [Pedobacter riviphilus]